MMAYQVGQCIYEGKSNRLHQVADMHGTVIPGQLIIERTDNITKLDGDVRDSIEGKGVCANRISNLLFQLLERNHLPTHFLEELDSRRTLIRETEPLKLEVIVRNIATGSLCKRLPIADGTILPFRIIELDYKNDAYHDPLINHDHALALGLVANQDELFEIEEMAECINRILQDFFSEIGIILVDFKLEFGRTDDDTIIVIDEISPDTCRLWDLKTKQPLDKDLFRKGMGDDATIAAYREVLDRLTGQGAEEDA